MQVDRIIVMAAATVVIAFLTAALAAGEAQERQERLAHSNGQGILRVGDERFKINSVIVKLSSDRKAEVTLVSEITIFLTGTWSNHNASPQEIDLDMTGDTAQGGLEGVGKIFLSDDGKAVPRLSLKGVSRNTKRIVEATFEGK